VVERRAWIISSAKGKGLFALRDFARHEHILVERSYKFDELVAGSLGLQAEFAALMLDGASKRDKFKLNCLAGDSPSARTLAIRISRANHDCLPNAYHYLEPATRVKLLLTSSPIVRGDEITISYILEKPPPIAMLMLQSKWASFAVTTARARMRLGLLK
jgi:hypothetical protein